MEFIARMDEVKKQHHKLSRDLQGELKGVAKPFGGDTHRRRKFLKDVDSLLKELKEINENMEVDVREYGWLSDTVSQWQFALSSILGVPKDIPILQPPKYVGKTTISDPEVHEYLDWRAHEISLARRQQDILRRLGEELHRLQMSSKNQVLEDWHNAEICFASDILKGEGELWKKVGGDVRHESQTWKFLSSAVFRQLQKSWLNDVIKFHAYVKWMERGADASSDTKDDYIEACHDFSCRVGNNAIKFGGEEVYDNILDYLTNNYLSGPEYRLSYEKPGVQGRVEEKAHRIFCMTGSRDDKANWIRAETYVEKFYNNVVAAILDNAVSKDKLREAFSFSENPKYGCSITDCFEAMVLVYYVKDINLSEVWTA